MADTRIGPSPGPQVSTIPTNINHAPPNPGAVPVKTTTPQDDPRAGEKTTNALKQQASETKGQQVIAGQMVQQGLNQALGSTTQAGVFSGKGIKPEDVEIKDFDNPEHAAAQILKYEKTDPKHASLLFHEHVSQHKDDPKYLKGLFGSLGGEKSKEFIIRSHDHLYLNKAPRNSKGHIEEYTKGVRDALNTLHKSGDLTDADVRALINKSTNMPYQTYGADSFAKLATSISTLPHSSDKLKQSFAEGAMQLYEKNKGKPDAAVYVTSAAELIGQTEESSQISFMGALNKQDK